MKIVKISQRVPDMYTIGENTPFVYSERLVDTTSSTGRGGTSNKEYIVRVYQYGFPIDTHYAVIAFNGRIGQRLTQRFKGSSENYDRAIRLASRVLSEKLSQARSNYERSGSNYDANNLVGINSTVSIDELNRGRMAREREEQERDRIQREVEKEHVEEQIAEEYVEKVTGAIQNPNFEELSKDTELLHNILETIGEVSIGGSSFEGEIEHIEEFIHLALNSSIKDKVLNLSKDVFDKIRMTDEDRKMVEDHYSRPLNEELQIPEAFKSLFSEDSNWYRKADDLIKNELKDYFKYSIKIRNERKVYNVWWEGYGDGIRITKSDMPKELFIEYNEKIKNEARKKSDKAYLNIKSGILDR